MPSRYLLILGISGWPLSEGLVPFFAVQTKRQTRFIVIFSSIAGVWTCVTVSGYPFSLEFIGDGCNKLRLSWTSLAVV